MLERFGFTPTESKSYQALLKLGGSTGYAVARDLGIARANVYQALESLVRRGAVRKAATIPSQYSAAQPAALIAQLERSFRHNLLELDESLSRLPKVSAVAAPGLELILAADQLLARAVAAAGSAGSELLAVTGPWAAELNDALGRAGSRGAAVRCVSLGEPGPEGALVRAVPERDLQAYWGGLPVAVVADRARAVFGVLAGGGLASGLDTTAGGAVPFLRHLLRRELAGSG